MNTILALLPKWYAGCLWVVYAEIVRTLQ